MLPNCLIPGSETIATYKVPALQATAWSHSKVTVDIDPIAGSMIFVVVIIVRQYQFSHMTPSVGIALLTGALGRDP